MYWPTLGAHTSAMLPVLPLPPKPVAPPLFEGAPEDVPTGLPVLAPELPVADPDAEPPGVVWSPHPDPMMAISVMIGQGPFERRANQSILRGW